MSVNQSFAKWLPKTKIALPYLSIALITVLVNFSVSPTVIANGTDREVFRYMGMLISLGGMPYLDAFYDKPPLIYLLAALVHGMGPWGLWFLECVFVAVAAMVFYRFAKVQGWVFPCLHALLLVIWLRTPGEVWKDGGRYGDTRSFVAPLLMILFVLLCSKINKRFLIGGVIAGALVMLQQEALLPLMGFVPVLLYSHPRKIQIVSEFIMGVMLAVGSILLWLYSGDAFGTFYTQTVDFAFSYHVSLLERLGLIAMLPGKLLYFQCLVPLVLVVFVGLVMIRKNKIGYLEVAIFLALFMQLISISLTGNFMWDYFIPIFPFLSLATGFAVTRLWQWKGSVVAIVVASAIYITPFLPVAKVLGRTYFGTRAPDYYSRFAPVKQEIEHLHGSHGEFFAMREGRALSINTDLEIIAPTKWIHYYVDKKAGHNTEAKIKKFNDGVSELDSILTDLELAETSYILDNTGNLPLGRDPQSKWMAYLKQHYDPILQNQKYGVLWKRRK